MKNNITIREIEQIDRIITILLANLVREGAERLIEAALEAEADQYITRYKYERDDNRFALVVRNGYARVRSIETSIGTLSVRAPRIYDKRANRRFVSQILPPFARRTLHIHTQFPFLYLHGLATGDFQDALRLLFKAHGRQVLNSNFNMPLLNVCRTKYQRRQRQSFKNNAFVEVGAAVISYDSSLKDNSSQVLAIIGRRPIGSQEIIAVGVGEPSSPSAWVDLLHELRRKGLKKPPPRLLAAKSLPIWSALSRVYPGVGQLSNN